MLNSFVRASLLNGVVPAYAALLRKQLGRNLQLEVRNSSLSSKDYSALLSDLDLAVIGDFSDDEIKKLRDVHDRIRRVLVFIGELEIYLIDEWVARPTLLQILEPYYTPLRLIRKIRWMIRIIDTSSKLAALRARRGLDKALTKLNIQGTKIETLRGRRQEPIEPALAKISEEIISSWNLRIEPLGDSFKFHHPMLELTFVDGVSPEPRGPYVRSKSENALLLAAIFPQPAYDGLDAARLNELRSNPKVREYLQAFSRFELNVMTASVRGLSEIPDWYEANRKDFESALRQSIDS